MPPDSPFVDLCTQQEADTVKMDLSLASGTELYWTFINSEGEEETKGGAAPEGGVIKIGQSDNVFPNGTMRLTNVGVDEFGTVFDLVVSVDNQPLPYASNIVVEYEPPIDPSGKSASNPTGSEIANNYMGELWASGIACLLHGVPSSKCENPDFPEIDPLLAICCPAGSFFSFIEFACFFGTRANDTLFADDDVANDPEFAGEAIEPTNFATEYVISFVKTMTDELVPPLKIIFFTSYDIDGFELLFPPTNDQGNQALNTVYDFSTVTGAESVRVAPESQVAFGSTGGENQDQALFAVSETLEDSPADFPTLNVTNPQQIYKRTVASFELEGKNQFRVLFGTRSNLQSLYDLIGYEVPRKYCFTMTLPDLGQICPPPSPPTPPPYPPPFPPLPPSFPGCECEVFTNGLTTEDVGRDSCGKFEPHGPDGVIKQFCKPTDGPFVPMVKSGCPDDWYRCLTSYTKSPFVECTCDEYRLGAFKGNPNGMCQVKNKEHYGGKAVCYQRNYKGDKMIGELDLFGCPADMYLCDASL